MERSTLGLPSELVRYIHENNPPEHPALAALRAETSSLPEARFQISSEQAHLLQFLIRLSGARAVLELGTYTGYSALAMALALPEDGEVITCDISTENVSKGMPYWAKAAMQGKIRSEIGPALDTLAQLELQGRSFDLAFIDADKENYEEYFEVCYRLVRRGGVIVLDNMLRRGRVANPPKDDPDAHIVVALNSKIAADERFYRVLLSVADGMTLARKR